MANTNLFSFIFFTQVDLCSQSYFVSSEGHEPHLERWKQKTDVGESEKMKGNCKIQIKTCLAVLSTAGHEK